MKKDKKLIIIIAAAVVIICTIIAIVVAKVKAGSKSSKDKSVNTATATIRDISSELSSSGTIAAKNTYNITSLSSGTIISADFEEGDYVEKGQVLYVIDSSSAQSELNSATNSLTRAQNNYEDASKDYNTALSDYSGNTYKSTRTGYITNLYIQAGDKVSGNTQIADIYNDKQMKIRIPFLSGETAAIGIGSVGVLTLSDSLEQLNATVIAISNMDEVLDGGRLVRYVTFQVDNPGGLTTTMTATATVGEFVSAGEGTFQAITDGKMNADLSSTVEVAAVLVTEGDYVTKGTPIFRMTSDSAEDLLRSYKDSLDNAQEKVESAQNNLDKSQETYDNYTITAPISGQVITKTYKAGDKINSGNSSSNTVLATIYDMSSYTFEMSIDEMDVQSVEVGQSVVVTADAYDGKTFSGKVTNVSLESSVSNGVSTYPVTVTLDDTYDLLPGMNVDGTIVLASVSNALTIPADALMRGNKVYVKDDSVKTSEDGVVPAGFRAVDVETGLINDSYVQILSGLSEGDVVYVAESSNNTSDMMMGPGGGMGGGMPGGGGGAPGGGGGAPGGGGPGM